MKTLVWPVVTYGAEAWTMKTVDEKRIEAMEMWCYRRMLRIRWTDRRTNISILKQLNLKRKLLRSIKKRKLRFFGHAYRAYGNAKTTISGTYPEKKRSGRPRKQYEDNIREWLNCSMAESVRIVSNRERWRRKVETALRGENGNARWRVVRRRRNQFSLVQFIMLTNAVWKDLSCFHLVIQTGCRL